MWVLAALPVIPNNNKNTNAARHLHSCFGYMTQLMNSGSSVGSNLTLALVVVAEQQAADRK